MRREMMIKFFFVYCFVPEKMNLINRNFFMYLCVFVHGWFTATFTVHFVQGSVDPCFAWSTFMVDHIFLVYLYTVFRIAYFVLLQQKLLSLCATYCLSLETIPCQQHFWKTKFLVLLKTFRKMRQNGGRTRPFVCFDGTIFLQPINVGCKQSCAERS